MDTFFIFSSKRRFIPTTSHFLSVNRRRKISGFQLLFRTLSPPIPRVVGDVTNWPLIFVPVSFFLNRNLTYFLGTLLAVGVAGLALPISDACANLCLFSAGFSIWNEHISVSSTLIMAPALSNSPQ